jgi:outer membrane immunogenic protein
MMKSLPGGLVIAALTIATACAADLPRRSTPAYADTVYAPASVFSWTGFYAGGTVGYGSATYRDSVYFDGANGFALGATGGYNFQSGNLVVGVEGDLNWTDLTDRHTFAAGVTSKASANTLLTVRGRLGYGVDRALIYATGGYAGGNVKAQLFDPTLPAVYDSSSWHHGYAIGAGIEYAFTSSLSAKAEYLFTSLNASDAFAVPHATRVGLHENLVRVGLNYHF